jgi:hypothetical protein
MCSVVLLTRQRSQNIPVRCPVAGRVEGESLAKVTVLFQSGRSWMLIRGIIRGSTQISGNLTIKILTVTPSCHSLLRSSPLGCLSSPNIWELLRRRMWKLGVTEKQFFYCGQIPRIFGQPFAQGSGNTDTLRCELVSLHVRAAYCCSYFPAFATKWTINIQSRRRQCYELRNKLNVSASPDPRYFIFALTVTPGCAVPQLLQVNSEISTPGRNDVSNDTSDARFEVPATVLS